MFQQNQPYNSLSQGQSQNQFAFPAEQAQENPVAQQQEAQKEVDEIRQKIKEDQQSKQQRKEESSIIV